MLKSFRSESLTAPSPSSAWLVHLHIVASWIEEPKSSHTSRCKICCWTPRHCWKFHPSINLLPHLQKFIGPHSTFSETVCSSFTESSSFDLQNHTHPVSNLLSCSSSSWLCALPPGPSRRIFRRGNFLALIAGHPLWLSSSAQVSTIFLTATWLRLPLPTHFWLPQSSHCNPAFSELSSYLNHFSSWTFW